MAFDLLLKAGSVSQIIEVTIRDASTGQGKAAIAPGSVTYSYRKRGAAGPSASGACVAMTVGTWADHGWAEVDSANRPGEYQFGVSDAAFIGTDEVTIRFKIAGCIDKEVKIVLTAVNLQDAAAAGISRLDASVSSRQPVFTPIAASDVWTYATRTLSDPVSTLSAADVWTYANRSLTDKTGFADNAAITAIKGQTDRITFVDHGDGTFDIRATAVNNTVVDSVAIAAAIWSAGTRTLTDKSGFTIAGTVDANVVQWNGAAPFVYAAPDNAAIAAIQAQTDKLFFTEHGDGAFDVRTGLAPVDNSAIASAVWSAATRTLTAPVEINSNADLAAIRAVTDAYVAPDNAGLLAIKAQTDRLFFSDHGDSTWDVRSSATSSVVVDNAAVAAAVWSAASRTLTDKSGFALADGSISATTFTAGAINATVAPNLDVAIGSRMASFAYVAPDNAAIAAIRAQTDQLVFIAGDVRATLDGETVSASVSDASIAAAVWANAARTVTGGTLDSVTTVTSVITTTDAAAISAIKAATDKITFLAHGDGTFDVQGNATATVDTAAVASAVWTGASRTITGGAIDTNRDKAGYGLAAGEYIVIGNAVWNATDRVITGGAIDTNKDKLGYLLAADQYTSIAGAIWTDSERGQIRYALGLSGTRKATDGDGVTDSIYRITSKLQFNSQSDVIASLDGETVHLNPMQNFNNIGQRDEVPAQESTLRLRLTDTRAAKIDNLDTQISTRSSHSPGDVWSFNSRTLTSFGTLVSDIAAAVWTFASRTLSGFGSLVSDIWSAVSRTITAGTVDLSTQAKADVRAAADAALVDYDPLTYSDAAFDRDQIIDQVEAVLAAVRVKPDAATIAAAVDALLTTNHGAGDWRDTSHGVGPVAYTVRVTDGTNPIAMASARLSVGPVGISLTTGADGTAAFDMQPGIYTLRIAKLGYSGHTATVTINAEPAAQGYDAQVNPLATISAPPDPDKCTSYLTTYDGVGNKESGVSIELRLVSPPPGNAQAFSAKPWTVLSDGDGIVQVALLKNAAYQARRGSGEWHLVKTPNADTIPLPTVLSHPNR